jgi:hypothetical protein
LQKPSMQTVPPVQDWFPLLPAPHWLPRFVEVPHTSYVLEPSATGLHVSSAGWLAQAFWFGASHEIQQSWCRQMEPMAHASCVPSFTQVNEPAWLGMQPFSSQTSPGLAQVPPVERGTHAPPTHTWVALPQSLVTVQAFATTEHTPSVVLQV